MKKKIIATLLILAMVMSVFPEKISEAKSKDYLIKSLSKSCVKYYDYNWNWNDGFTPKGKAKKMKITGKTKFYLADPNASLADEGTPVKVSLSRMKKVIKKYRKQGWHMKALIKYKNKKVISITEQIQDW